MADTGATQLFPGWNNTQLALWREGRGEGVRGMQAIGNVIFNTAKKRKITCDQEVARPLRYSSMTAPGDPQLHLFPHGTAIMWPEAQRIADRMFAAQLEDITFGATLYYAPYSIKTDRTITVGSGRVYPLPEDWNPAVMHYTVTIGNHIFFREG